MMDESPLQVLKEPGRAVTSDKYMWLSLGGQPDKQSGRSISKKRSAARASRWL